MLGKGGERTLEARTEEKTCTVTISFSQDDAANLVAVNTVVTAIIQRKLQQGNWTDVRTIDIASPQDLNFTATDYSVRSFTTYEYRIALIDRNGSIYYTTAQTVDVQFSALLVANEDKQYVCIGNPKYSITRTHNIAFVKPYNSRYPHSVKNGISNYNTGTIDGYFNPLDNNCSLARVYADFSDALIDYLTDGRPKIIKTPEGHAWYAQIDPQVKLSNDNILGIVLLSFSWTEISEMPTLVCVD